MDKVSIHHALRRGAFHAAVGLSVVAVRLLLPETVALSVLIAGTLVFLFFDLARLNSLTLRRKFSTWFVLLIRPEEEERLTGSSYFMAGCLLTVLVFPREIAALAIVFLALGDPAAAVVDAWKGNARLWRKSLWGDLACIAVCLLAATLVAIFFREPRLAVAITGGIFAGIFQAVPLRLNDNLTIPIGSALAMAIAGLF